MTTPHSGFSDVDGSPDPEALIRFLDQRNASSFFVDNRSARLHRLALRPGETVLEVGCGTGDFTRELQSVAGPSGAVVGLDRSAIMLATARARSGGSNAVPRYCLGDASRLPFPAAAFDACTAERVLFHLADPEAAVAELARVARPGARVAFFEPDWSTMKINAGDLALTGRIISLYVDRLANPGAARALPGLLYAAGFKEVSFMEAEHVLTARSEENGGGLRATLARAIGSGALTREEVTAWGASVREAEAAGRYRFSVTFLLVSARKPSRPSV